MTAPDAVNDALRTGSPEEVRNDRDRIDPRALRDAFGAFLTGVTVVTAN